jgi:two-component system, NarL family, nitrate/nitrite response regulator NarL
MISIALIEDHHIVQEGVKQLLSRYANFNLLWCANSQAEALEKIDEIQPDVLVSDIHLPDGSGYEISKYVLEKYPQVKIIFLSMFFEPQYIYKSVEMGVLGYLTKESTVEELVIAIDKVSLGENYYGQQIVKNLLKYQTMPKKTPRLDEKLSVRELEILQLTYQGLHTKEIADKLFLSEKTVANHRLNIMSKLNVTNSIQLIKLYITFMEDYPAK